MQSLVNDSISRTPGVDPHGFLFQHENEIYRFVYEEFVSFYIEFLNSACYQQLAFSKKLVNTDRTTLALHHHSKGEVFHHEKIHPLSFCTEWCSLMLQDAAVLTLEIGLELSRHNLILQDAHPWNILFKYTNPVLIDFTSITPAKDIHLIWPAYSQFLCFFLHPLLLCQEGKGEIARLFLLNTVEGVPLKKCMKYISRLSCIKYFKLLMIDIVERWLNKDWIKAKLVQTTLHKKNNIQNIRTHFFLNKLQKVKDIKISIAKDNWTSYYKDLNNKDCNKKEIVFSLLQKINPKGVLDLGCNTGVYSIMAAEFGCPVIATDGSEACISELYLYAKRHQLPILPLVVNLFAPPPPYGFMNTQYPALLERIASDSVLCLALMHHLYLTGCQSLENIASLINSVSKRALIFEYISVEDANIQLISSTSDRKLYYTLDEVKKALSKYFPHITSFPSDRPTRKLLLCEK